MHFDLRSYFPSQIVRQVAHSIGSGMGPATRLATTSSATMMETTASKPRHHQIRVSTGFLRDAIAVHPGLKCDTPMSECAVGCPRHWIGDGMCDSSWMTEACLYDLGDCRPGWNHTSPPNSTREWLVAVFISVCCRKHLHVLYTCCCLALPRAHSFHIFPD